MQVVKGDITRLQVDAIVNAANNTLLGGGGVDGAIHKAAGPELMTACAAFGVMPHGRACVTPGFRLPARYVIHTAGPFWCGGRRSEPEMLRQCYRACLEIAHALDLESIAFPAISTGVYGFPPALAFDIAVREIRENMRDMKAIMCCFTSKDEALCHEAIARHGA